MPPVSRITDEQLRAAAEAHSWSLRATARALGVDHGTISDRLMRLKQVVSPGPPKPIVTWPPEGYEPHAARAARAVAAAKAGGVRSIVTIPDAHRPVHNKRAWELTCGILREVKPDVAIIMGDLMNMTALDHHTRKRPDLSKLSAEYYDANVGLDELQESSPDSEWIYLGGNHEDWAYQFECAFGQLDGMLSVPVSLYMEPRPDGYKRSATAELRGMTYVPYTKDQHVIRDGVLFCHGYGGGKYPAPKYAATMGPRYGARTVVFAHHHQFGYACTDAGFQAFGCGFIGDESAHEFDYLDGPPSWRLGVLHIAISSANVTVTQVPFVNGRALLGGHVVQAAA